MADNSRNLATLSSIIKKAIESALKDTHTSMPGIVESFDADTQLASVQPAIKRIFKTTDPNDTDIEILTARDLPILINVPVVFPRGGGYVITFPINKGDEVLLDFSERSIDKWYDTGRVSRPQIKRRHSLSDAIAIPGLSSKNNAIPNFNNNAIEIKSENGSAIITLEDSGDISMNCSNISLTGEVTVDGNVKLNNNLEVSGSSTLSATVTSGGTNIGKTHVHQGSPTAPTGPITPTGVPI